MKKPIVEYNSQGMSGNIYYILGLVQKALRKQQRINDYNELRDKVFESKSYEQALGEISKYIDLVDVAKPECEKYNTYVAPTTPIADLDKNGVLG